MTFSKPIVAVFDFDHTLTTKDSLLPFLFFTQGWLKTSLHLLTLSSSFISFIFNRSLRQQVKEDIITTFYAGTQEDELKKWGKQYADEELDVYLNQKAMQKLNWHQSQQHRCLLVSASLDIYLMPWAKRHGFETVLSSQLQIDSLSRVTGKIQGLNCWGPEKQRRLLDYLGPKENYDLYVYGDSRGDQEILQLADYPFYRQF